MNTDSLITLKISRQHTQSNRAGASSRFDSDNGHRVTDGPLKCSSEVILQFKNTTIQTMNVQDKQSAYHTATVSVEPSRVNTEAVQISDVLGAEHWQVPASGKQRRLQRDYEFHPRFLVVEFHVNEEIENVEERIHSIGLTHVMYVGTEGFGTIQVAINLSDYQTERVVQ